MQNIFENMLASIRRGLFDIIMNRATHSFKRCRSITLSFRRSNRRPRANPFPVYFPGTVKYNRFVLLNESFEHRFLLARNRGIQAILPESQVRRQQHREKL